MTADSYAKAVIEAALFASGRTLSPNELADLSGLSQERALSLADDLAAEYASRGSGIEIKSIGEGYSMQVRFGLAGRVLSFAPKEIEAPLIRTLAIIAYKQPILRQEIERLAPTHLAVPSGSRIPIDYTDPDAPFVAVRLQEVFGLTGTPRVAGGRVALTLQLLSPAQRPVQVTRDLESFWARGYAEVRRELKGRYPRHYWPDDPMTATPTRRVRPK